MSDADPGTAPFGSWPSPITADLIAGSTIRLGQLALQGEDIFWSEGRPAEQGRNVVVRCTPEGRLRDLNPAPFDVRTRVNEYGGGAFALCDASMVFSHFPDQQLYCASGEAVKRLTAETSRRYADACVDAARGRLIAVCEDHGDRAAEAVTTLVAVSLATGAVSVLEHGHDFYAAPRLSPDGRHLAWLAWDHPNMPWDGCTLWLADVAKDGGLASPRSVAGSAVESIFQPAWSPRGELHFVSDRSGWWNLYRVREGRVEALHPMAAEFGEPQWAFGMSTYGFDAGGRIVCILRQHGRARLARLDPDTRRLEPIATPFCSIGGLKVGADFAVFIGATPTEASAVVRLDLPTGTCRVLRRSSTTVVDPGFVSTAEAISFPTESGLEAHAFFYPPRHPAVVGPAGAKPPLIVIGHGGPTGSADPGFAWALQFWTSRGFGVVDVNYGGSWGYGRAYRDRLRGAWGVVDVDDSVNAARYLVARGDADPDRVIVRGASAGGYTALCALTFRRYFKAGASHYGIGDLEALVRDTHKFESRYLDGLIGPYPAARSVYLDRSPIHHAERLASPMILFQGAEDKAVPPAQAEAMFAAVDAKGLPVALLMFEGEQHGFRRAATIKRVLEAELHFYGRVFGFVPADDTEPVDIRNLEIRRTGPPADAAT